MDIGPIAKKAHHFIFSLFHFFGTSIAPQFGSRHSQKNSTIEKYLLCIT